MGLAASQARLLSITARMHDVEFEAQDIMQKKVTLATRKDELYEEYCRALDAKKIQVAYSHDGVLNFVDATFATMCGYQEGRKGTYALTDPDTGNMVVDDEVYEAYQNFRGGDKYAFAFEMLGFETTDGFTEGSVGDATLIGVQQDSEHGFGLEFSGEFKDSETGETIGYILMNDIEASVYNNHETDLSDAMNKFNEALKSNNKEQIQSALESFRKTLYDKCAKEIFEGMADNSQFDASDYGEFDQGEFNYYVKLFEGIEAAGGCTPVSKYAENGSTDNDWFNNVIQSGTLLLNEYKTGANKGWQTINTATCVTIQEVSDDAKIKKAEAVYQHELSKVNAKDKRYDQELNKLETERTALDKQRESIEKVENDNIERTFGIFS